MTQVPATLSARGFFLPLWQEKPLRRLVALQFLVVLVTAWRSETFFHPDEHFQTVEFASSLLGWTATSALPWEFGAQMRPWFQPMAYAGVMRVLGALGVHDAFALLTALRLFTALFAWLAYTALLSRLVALQPSPLARLRLVQASLALGFLPYLFARTSSETAAAAFTVLSLLALDLPAAARPTFSPRRLFVAGLLAGLAFECRFQMAFLLVGTTLWWLWYERPSASRIGAFFLGGALALGIGTLADRVGYGVWTFAPYNYLHHNVILGVASKYGVEPLPALLWLLPANLFGPIVLLCMVLLARVWWLRPRSALTWGTLLFVLIHSLVGHKEERFLFPIAFLLPWVFAETLPSEIPTWPRWLRPLCAWNFLLVLLFAVYPVGWRPHHAFFRHMNEAPAAQHVLFRGQQPFVDTPFLQQRRTEFRVEGRDPLPTDWNQWTLLTPDPFVEPLPPAGTHLRLAWSEMPFRQTPLWPYAGPFLERAWHAWQDHTLSGMPRPTWLTLWAIEPGPTGE